MRLRSTVVMVVAAATLLFGALVAEAGWGWWWNAEVDIDGTQLRTIWTVKAINGDSDGSDNYAADINIVLAEGATVGDVLPASNEAVTIGFDPDLDCGGGIVEAVVTFNVTGLTDDVGKKVKVKILADGEKIGKGKGRLGDDVVVSVDIPVEEGACAGS